MEISKHQIARLVLGYLKSENCKTAFNEFLMKSPYLKAYAVFVKNGKYFATRVGGLTLEDILAEYSDIALIVQGRLEHTDYYEKGHKMKLSEQLTYILDNNSRSSSPALPKNLDATPMESLPGNSTNHSPKSPTSSSGKSVIDTEKSTSNNRPGPSDKDEKSLVELDNQIRSIKQKAEKDPVFDKLLEEIIGHRNEASTDTSTTKNTENNRTTIMESLTTSQNTSAGLNLDVAEPQSCHGTKKANSTVTDPYTVAPAPLTQQNQFFLTSSGGLLMLPPLVTASNYVFLNGSQQTTAPPSNALTETDIMKMPTLIVDDTASAPQTLRTSPISQASQLPAMVTQSQIIVTSTPQPMTASQNVKISTSTLQKPKTLKTIAPKTSRKITICSSDGGLYKEIDLKEVPVESPVKPAGRPGLRKRQARNKETPPIARSSPVKNTDSERKKKSAKSLFQEKKTTKGTWDAEMRELMVPKDTVREEGDDKMDVTCDDEELNREAMMIEAAFKTPVKAQQEQKVAATTEKTPEDKKESETEGKPPVQQPDESELEEQVTMIEQTEVYLRNCNGPPRIKKKCNESGTAELFEVSEVVEETVIANSVVIEKKITSLETPMKGDLPKTPGKSEMTPFSKAIEEQLQGMDLLSLPTPSVVIPTPSFPITPNAELCTPEHHSNRPTDYSTSSSYYQPSDSEQNKSFELMMEQYRKEERKKVEEKKVESVAEMKRLFNKNVIGQKNLSLMKKGSSGSSSSSSSSSSSGSSGSESSSDSDSESEGEAKNEPENAKESYSFRKRKAPIPPVDSKEIVKTSPADKKVTVKEKKERTKVVKKVIVKNSNSAVRKNPPRSKTTKNETKSTKASEQLEKCDNENEVTDDDFALHLSTDEDSVNKVNNERGVNKIKEEATSRSTRKEEPPTEAAKQLIQDLYERGIHLLPKASTEEDPSRDPNALENLDVSSEESCMDETNRSMNPEDVTFDCKTYDENDQMKVVYDSSKRRKKKVYDLNLLKKKIEADVYIESLDIDVKRFITFTPTVTVLDYSPKRVPVKRRKSVKLEGKTTQTKVKKQEEARSEKGGLEKEDNASKEAEKKTYSNKLRNRGTADQNAAKKPSVDGNKKESPLKSDGTEAKVPERLEGEKDDMPSLGDGDDDLMNFAILGEPTEKDKKPSGKSREKRKLSSCEESSQPEKKTKTETEKQALLKNVNVDLFLNELHGGSKSTK